MPTHPVALSLTLFSRRRGGNKIKKLVGLDKKHWLEPVESDWNLLKLAGTSCVWYGAVPGLFSQRALLCLAPATAPSCQNLSSDTQ